MSQSALEREIKKDIANFLKCITVKYDISERELLQLTNENPAFNFGAILKNTDQYVPANVATKKEHYICPECFKDLILCKGQIRQPYFRHIIDTKSPCHYYSKPTESQIHKDAKLLLKYILSLQQNTIIQTCNDCKEPAAEFKIPCLDANNIKFEYNFQYNGSKKADVACIVNDKPAYIFEIYHTHKTPEGNRPEPWFEFKAADLVNFIYTKPLYCTRSVKCSACANKPVIESIPSIKKCKYADERGEVFLKQLARVEKNGLLLRNMGKIYKNNRQLVLAAVEQNGLALEFAGDELRNDREIVLAAFGRNWMALKFASDDREIVLAAVGRNWKALKFASDELKNNYNIVLAAVKQNGLALQYASDEIKSNKDIVLAAVTQDGWALDYASQELKANYDLVLAAVTQNGCLLHYASNELKGNYNIVLAAVTQDGWALDYASQELKANYDLVLAAVTQSGQALRYASQELKANYDLVLAAVTQSGQALRYASQELKANYDLVLAAITQDGSALTYASKELKNDKDFGQQVLKIDYKFVKYVGVTGLRVY